MKRAITYHRVSTAQQADEGVSLHAQQAKTEAMATVQDAVIVETIVDAGESAKSLRRPGMEKLLSMVNRKEVDTVIIYKLDRLTRSVKDLAELLDLFDRKGVSLVSVEESLDTASAAGRLVINIMGSVSQWEREVIGERTASVLQHKKKNGERVGTIPFGYKLSEDSVKIEPENKEQKIIEKILDLKNAGLSHRRITDELNHLGYKTRCGSEWKHQYVANLLRSSA